jgi:type VI secretion system protein ImpK
MTLPQLCEPLFQYLCRLNRSGRKGAPCDLETVKNQVKALFTSMKATAAADYKLNTQYEKIEFALKFFVDSILADSRLGIAAAWHKSRLAYEWKELAGDEKFFDLLEETLKEPTEEATERLVIYYTCIGMGFSGWYTGKPDHLKRKMAQIAERIRGYVNVDDKTRICPEAYDHTDVRNLIEPPARKVVGIVIAVVGLALVLFITNLVLYRQASRDLAKALRAIMTHKVETMDPPASPNPASQGSKEARP